MLCSASALAFSMFGKEGYVEAIGFSSSFFALASFGIFIGAVVNHKNGLKGLATFLHEPMQWDIRTHIDPSTQIPRREGKNSLKIDLIFCFLGNKNSPLFILNL